MQTITASRRDEASLRVSIDSVGVSDLIPDDRFFQTLEDQLPPHRERLYTPTQTLAMFVSPVLSDDRSCRHVVDEHVAHCAAHRMRIPSSSTGAYCDARQRLPLELIGAMTKEVARVARSTIQALDGEPATVLIDGTGFSMPDTPKNQAVFPQSASQKEGCGFPQGRLVARVCATTGAACDCCVNAAKGKGTGETTTLRELVTKMAPGTVCIGDAIYDSFFSWSVLADASCFGVFEVGGSSGLPYRVPDRITIKPPCRPTWMSCEEYRLLPRTISLRVVLSTRPACRDKYLLTTLLDTKAYTDDDVRALYDKRWDIEVDFRNLKKALDLGVLGCKTPEMVNKELAVHLLGYNVIRLLMFEAAQAGGLEPRQISFRHTHQLWSAWVLMGAALDERSWKTLLQRITQHRVPLPSDTTRSSSRIARRIPPDAGGSDCGGRFLAGTVLL